MTKRIYPTFLKLVLMVSFVMLLQLTQAQAPLPFVITNNSPFPDNQLYVAIVGEDFSGNHIWVDCKTSTSNLMHASYNTVQGPVYNGDLGPGGNGMYAACFSKLSEIPNKTVMLPPIQGCRMFISVGQQLYFYFFGANGAVRGYSTPSHTNPNDPNKGIRYEMIEVTYNQLGVWGNTSRVDSYNYPMGLEVYSSNGTVEKTGELKTHAQIGAEFLASVPDEFKGCYDPETGIIMQPTKTKDFADGSIGTMPVPGPYVNYMKPYIDAIWNKYTNEDLLFTTLEGNWKGRVVNERLEITCTSGAYAGRTGIIERRPTTQEALEGKGVLDKEIGDGTIDLYVQSQICAAITRHVINVTTPNVGMQSWSDPSKYYLESPCNHYAKFWHREDISINKKAYGFAYDDVNDQSSTLHSTNPTKVVVIFGGYASNNTPPEVSITAPADNASFEAPASINFTATATDTDGSVTKVAFYNGDQMLGEDDSAPYSFTWNNVNAGSYTITAVATDNEGATKTSSPITVKVTIPQSPYGGTRWNIPGTIEAENYDLGGQDVAYNDVTPNNEGGAYRNDAVDIEAINGGGYNVGYIANGEWLEYMVNISTTGIYKIEAMVAAIADGKTFRLEMDGTIIGTFTVPNTGGWQNFQKIEMNDVELTSGPKVLRFVATSDEFNIDKMTFTFIPSNQPPSITITAPAENTTYIAPASIAITATASDADGSISKVAFFSNGTILGEVSSSPYTFNLTNITEGSYTITATATDNQGSTTTSTPVNITVVANQLPTVAITAPANNTTYIAPATFSITATATDTDGSIAKVEFYQNGQKVGEVTEAPYYFNISDLLEGTYNFTAKAIDNLGASANSASVSITVNENQKPAVSIISPNNQTSFIAPATINITANAQDADGSIVKVEFYNGENKLGEVNASPYIWNWTSVTPGSYELTAKAFDNHGGITVSSPIIVHVN
ncbi:MAG TPA: beta-1,3-glucanase family protein, partial [Cytophagaceae bacterium]